MLRTEAQGEARPSKMGSALASGAFTQSSVAVRIRVGTSPGMLGTLFMVSGMV